jgi:hypothetical protein
MKILYVIPYRYQNTYRETGFKTVLKWLQQRRDIDICVIEQDSTRKTNYMYIYNDGVFNKPLCFNTAVRLNPNYDYYVFADADIIIPELQDLETICQSHEAVRLFSRRLDLTNTHTQICKANIQEFYKMYKKSLQVHIGSSLASSAILMSKKLLLEVYGWDEEFCGWGRFDDFMAYKIHMITGKPVDQLELDALHLWHPLTTDWMLKSHNVELYKKYLKLNKEELIKMIEKKKSLTLVTS